MKMKTPNRILLLLALALFAALLAGCSTPTMVAQPTQDISAVRTDTARTVVAKITIDAALNPTSTQAPVQQPEPLVITATPQPSPTAAPPTATLPPLPPTPTQIPTAAPAAASSGSANPAPLPTRRSGPDHAWLISQEPFDGAQYSGGQEFDARWTFRNTGTSTWDTTYEYRFASGDNIAKKTIYTVPETVAPGKSVTLIADIVAPNKVGRYISNWELVNTNGDVFYRFYIVIDVR